LRQPIDQRKIHADDLGSHERREDASKSEERAERDLRRKARIGPRGRDDADHRSEEASDEEREQNVGSEEEAHGSEKLHVSHAEARSPPDTRVERGDGPAQARAERDAE
jgi:hypothetical protein